jgi:hypothetical protein
MNWSAELIKVKSSISNVIFPEIKCPRGILRNKMYRPDSAIIQISSSATKVCSIYPLRHTAVFPGHWTDAGADDFARDAAAALLHECFLRNIFDSPARMHCVDSHREIALYMCWPAGGFDIYKTPPVYILLFSAGPNHKTIMSAGREE